MYVFEIRKVTEVNRRSRTRDKVEVVLILFPSFILLGLT